MENGIKLFANSKNEHRVSISFPGRELDLYFSYETIVAFRYNGKLFISQNEWGTTTGKHLNNICRDVKIRIPHSELLGKLNYKVK